MTYRCMRDYVLVELETEPTLSPGGIILLPPKQEPRQSFGKVIGVGPGDRNKAQERIPMEVKTGERLAFSQYGHTKVSERMRIFREPSCHYVIDP